MKTSCVVIGILAWVLAAPGWAQLKPVTPDASPQAVALLEYLYEISGEEILTGQHNAPLNGSNRLAGMHKQTGEYPAVFGQDFGFSEPGSWDGINFRQNIVDEAIRRHREGFINTLMWHAVVPTQDEPGEFKTSVQAKLSDDEWLALTTPGTPLNERWKSQVDVIAWHLKQLQYAGVPVLWRPYHEMNGFWFWWGYRQGPEGFAKLWRMLFDRLVNFHQLDNLIWVWNANEMKENVPEYDRFYPGHDVVDVLATDVYTGRYDEENYRQLVALADGRPIGLGEVGALPTPEILQRQQQWVWFMSWRDPDNFFWNDGDSLRALFAQPGATSWHELPWVERAESIRIHRPVLD
ncbi:glycosyl hydrolase family 26 [Halioglobus maricola]|uniref:Glycosyl hydrolase family 26 n=1 Tax=Halioglobus maricola TaxID=2601894 RepID=A0A5P9NNE9_9GAMM|nr:glycosyl hydrolase [Halioglobus maricola]QFU77331.1 glycosyl hydrolase family 26 [Halioglobus maricola]